MHYNTYYYFGQKLFLFRRKAMDDKKIKVERYRLENKTAPKGQIVFTGSSLMEMFPIILTAL